MFHLSKIKHTLHLQPHLLSLPLLDAIKGELEMQFLDKVITNLGLCISVYDILSIDGGFIFPGDGCSTYEVIVRFVMFRPSVGEILRGKIEESNEDGLRLTLGFFNDTYVAVSQLQRPCRRGDDGIWLWNYDSQDLPLNLNEECVLTCRYILKLLMLNILLSLSNKMQIQNHLHQWKSLQESVEMVWAWLNGGRINLSVDGVKEAMELKRSCGQ